MNNGTLINDANLWKILKFLDTTEKGFEKEELENLCNEHISNLQPIFQFLCRFGYHFEFSESSSFVNFQKPDSRIEFSLSMAEWVAFQAHLFNTQNLASEKNFRDIYAKKLENIKAQYPHFDLYKFLESDGDFKNKHDKRTSLMASLDNSLFNKEVLTLSLKENKEVKVFPHRLVYLDNSLCLVGEECSGRCLIYIDIDALENYLVEDKEEYIPNYSPVEIDDFISATRSITGNEERLVIKILNPEMINLTPEYQFLGNPYMTLGVDGTTIWAASVEVGEQIYDWLFEIKDSIEILDPPKVIEEHQEYCLQKTSKKAS